jgi:hypothetical protein
MLEGSMFTSTVDFSKSAGSNEIWPPHLVNRPRVFETTMWRTEKWMAEWEGSMVQVLAGMVCGSFVLPKVVVTSFS